MKDLSGMRGLLDMMVHIADENAREVRMARLARWHGHGIADIEVVSEAFLENQEWSAFKAKLQRRSRLMSRSVDDLDGSVETRLSLVNLGDPEEGDVDVDEDDVDMLIAMINVLEQALPKPLTLTEVTRAMQKERVLSTEFVAVARQQTQRLLYKLRELRRAWQDSQGRWTLQ